MTSTSKYYIRLCGGRHDGADIRVTNGPVPLPPILAVPLEVDVDIVPVDPALWQGAIVTYTLASHARQDLVDLKTGQALGIIDIYYYHHV
jgi:hypothetical protein